MGAMSHHSTTAVATARTAGDARPVHPLWMRVTHWLNAIAVIVMVMSGWRIYDASPLFPFTIPAQLHAGWLVGRRLAVALCGHVVAGV